MPSRAHLYAVDSWMRSAAATSLAVNSGAMNDVSRHVSVLVDSGRDWYRAVRFPHISKDTGHSLGDDALDEQIRIRASEELVRLQAATESASERRAA